MNSPEHFSHFHISSYMLPRIRKRACSLRFTTRVLSYPKYCILNLRPLSLSLIVLLSFSVHLFVRLIVAVQFLWDCVIESVANQDSKNEQARGAILAHCMGLGKTLSVIAFLHTVFLHSTLLHVRTCLVICPVNTLLNWKHEFEIWLPPNDPMDVFELSAKPDNRQRVDVLKYWHNNVRLSSFSR